MSYTALYRKYRPATFDEVKGQDHVVVTLRNQIASDRIAHAYLFTGTRGTGKTSVAKIFAKAVNCEAPENGNPCNDCSCCREIASGSSLNVIEIDAASNNSVDDVRRIREEVAYSPTRGRYKVYIIDEAHMLSNQAFNALLKTLEEPPAYVIFILATTEAHKIPVTILSRCQRYDFHRISQEEITAQLSQLFEKEGISAEEKALRYIARKADGGMRDALSLADQCISFYLGKTMTYERVLDLLGAVDIQVLGQLYERILSADVAAVFRQLDQMIFHGRDLTQLVTDMTGYVRDLLVIKSSDRAEEILDVSEENLGRMAALVSTISEETLMRHIRIFSELSNDLRFSANRRILVETALIRMCRPQMETDIASLSERIRVLEKMLEKGIRPAAFSPSSSAGRDPGDFAAPDDDTAHGYDAPRYEKAAPEQLQQVKAQWKEIVRAQNDIFLRRIMEKAELRFDASDPESDVIYLVSGEIIAAEQLTDQEKVRQVEETIAGLIGRRIRVKILMKDKLSLADQKLRSITVEENLGKLIHTQIESEEESET